MSAANNKISNPVSCIPSSLNNSIFKSIVYITGCSILLLWLNLLSMGKNGTGTRSYASKSLASTKPYTNATMEDFLQQNHPECVLNGRSLDIKKFGKYIHMPNDPTRTKYDHVSCFVMKARYNCAKGPEDDKYNNSTASAYQFVFTTSVDNNDVMTNSSIRDGRIGPPDCHLRLVLSEMIEFYFNSFQQQTRKKVHTLMLGHSHVRQIWEAMACLLAVDHKGNGILEMTDLFVQLGGVDVSLELLSQGKKISVDEYNKAKPVSLVEAQTGGCHGPRPGDRMDMYYRNETLIPPHIPMCNDDVAMVEINNFLKISYIFRPMLYDLDTIEYICNNIFGIDDEDDETIIFSVWNRLNRIPQDIRPFNVTRSLDASRLRSDLIYVQTRDTGIYFRANNPWNANFPDGHACMPGVPDDEAYILLFLLLTGYDLART